MYVIVNRNLITFIGVYVFMVINCSGFVLL